MRRALLAFGLAALLTACQQPTAAPDPAAAPGAAPAPEMPADAPPQEEVGPAAATPVGGSPATCLDEIGAEASARLVARCIAVSPATHPPCNAANPCQMIQGEIDRSCEMIPAGEARPAECSA